MPITEQGAISGVFTLFSPEISGFGGEEQALLQQMGTDLTFALEQAAQAERLREAERQVLIAAERERAARAQREQARMLAESQRIAQIGSWQYDLHDPILWSAETYRLFGVDPTTFTPEFDKLLGLIHPEDRPAMQAWMTACAAGEPSSELLFRRLLPDGTVRYLAGQGELLYNAEGQPWRMAGTVQDITGRRLTELSALADEERLRLALNAAQLGIFEWDLASGQIDISPRSAILFSYPPETARIPFGHFTSRLHPADRDRVMAALNRSRSDRTPYACEYRVVWPDGQVVWIGASGEFSYGRDGQANRMRGIVADITARQEAQQALRESAARLAFALEVSHAGSWELDLASHTVQRTLAHDRIFGYAALLPEWTYAKFLAHVLPEDRAEVDRRFQATIATQGEWNCEFRIRRADQEVRWLWVIANFQRDADGQVGKLGGILQDITERKAQEAALRAAEAHQQAARYARSLIETSLDPLVTISPDGLITEVNAATEGAMGLTRAELIGADFASCFTDPAAARAGYQQAFASGVVRDYPLALRHREGRLTPVLYNAAVYRDAEGQVLGLFAAARDITAQLEAEAALRESNELFSMFMAHSPIYTYIKEVTPNESRVLKASENFLQMIGIAESNIIGKNMTELFPAELAAKIIADDWAVVSASKVLNLHEELSGRSYTTIKFPIRHRGKNLLAGYTIDITAQQEAEAALRESETRFRRLANSAPVLIWMAESGQGGTWFNDQWLAFTGRSLAEEHGNGWAEGVHPDDRERCLAMYGEYFAARAPFQREYRLRRHDGEYRWLLDHGVPLLDAEGQFSGYIGSCIDITPSKTLAEALERSARDLAGQTARLETILATISDGLHIVDAQGRLVECNASFARMLGYRRPGCRWPTGRRRFRPRHNRSGSRRTSRNRPGLKPGIAARTGPSST